MIRTLTTLLPIAILAVACGSPPEQSGSDALSETERVQALSPADPAFDGRWAGVLDAGAEQLRLELEIDLSGDEPSLILISVDQGGARVPMSIVRFDGAELHFSTPGLALQYDGVLEGGVITGTFNQGGLSTTLVFEPHEDQTRDEPSAETAPVYGEGVVVEVALEDGVLEGVLTGPTAPRAGLVLISGSGPQDRDGNIAGHPVYAAIADAMAEAGVASLRYDDRGVGGSDAPPPLTPSDLADDAVRALEVLQAETGLSCVGYLGHSEGGFLGLLAANESEADFMITLAGQHQDMETLLYDQSEALIRASGQGEDAVEANRELQTRVFQAIDQAGPGEAPAAIEAVLIELGLPEAAARQQGAMWGQPYAVAMFEGDPAAAAAAFEGPVLAVFAERDLQVLPEAAQAALLDARGDKPTRTVIVPGVDHIFEDSETGSPAEYGAAGHALSPTARAILIEETRTLIDQACTD
ncbi:alpha/beta hydrolase family protein [Oceanicaulis sp.]|uniref:alpha/beta hydrolase family protein n=1 Tax=Oceanicaulis sp. TaxID=1924941 RepID=UPI003D2876E6